MIDMHAHWKPVELADALRERTKEPCIVRNADGVEVLKSRTGEEPLAKAFDDVDYHLERMERQGVKLNVLSLLGSFCWIESQPLEVSLSLCRLVNDAFSKICREHEGRFLAHAALPLADTSVAAIELDRALGLPGVIGAQLPANFFLTPGGFVHLDCRKAYFETDDILDHILRFSPALDEREREALRRACVNRPA